MKKNSFLTFICACLPGFGQMYLGYMKRGVSLTSVFWITIFVSAFLNTPIFLIILPIVWAYAFFDTFNIRNLSPEQLANFPDRYIISSTELNQISKNFPFLKNKKFSKIIGYILIFIGVYAGYNSLLNVFSNTIFNFSSTAFFFLSSLPSFIIFLFVILLGIHMVGAGKKNAASNDTDEYFAPTNTYSDSSPKAITDAPSQEPTQPETVATQAPQTIQEGE